MKRLVLVWPDSHLLEKCQPVESFGPDTRFGAALHSLLDDMGEIVAHDGVAGLAAPQVGALVRAIVVKDADGSLLEMVNPEIVEATTDAIRRPEGCLSFPGQLVEVVRSGRIDVKWRDRNGGAQAGQFAEDRGIGLVLPQRAPPSLCRIIQHEIGHLDGVTLADHVGPMARDILRRRMLKAKLYLARAQAAQPKPEAA